ncbi:uncharacterized protein LOC131854371 [Achroia grisella]|uniref:uncharacterized protein LOC131854371 n=1 Tax=Achroia grisella TaxID=688607 RepID=UPI0027D2AB2C|nr:uncharacterized protein LOC131854371 [Achroia grisella]
MKLSLALVVFTFVLTNGQSPVDNIRNEFYTIEDQQWRRVNDQQWRRSGGDIELAKVFVFFNIESVQQKTRQIPHVALNSSWWRKPQQQIQQIENMYNKFLEFMTRQSQPGATSASSAECLNLVKSVLTDPKTAVSQVILDLQHSALSTFHNILQEQHQYFQRSKLCEMQMSPHQLIYDVYNTLALAEVKAYAMIQFSWMLKKNYETGNITLETRMARQKSEQRATETADAARIALAQAKIELYRCDPKKHKSGKTYEEVTRLLQGYIENEVDMNKEKSCHNQCSSYVMAKSYGCFKDKFCGRQPRCNGNIYECQFVESDMSVCTSSSRSNRRYEWIKYVNGHNLGRDSNCTLHKGTKQQVQSWWHWLVWHCSYCMCLCDDPENSDRYFSLREAISDIEKNKVITGIRIIKQGRMFHLQISQGTLTKDGHVHLESWVPCQIFHNTDPDVTDGVDYHTLSYMKRAIDLDDIVAPDGYVLTGVRFRLLGTHLNLSIRVTKLDFISGLLTPINSIWIGNDNTDASNTPRSRLKLIRPFLPTLSTAAMPENSRHDQFMEFTHSSFETDAAQTTVPFIDIQPIQPYGRGALLSGVGVMHRAEPGSGGFLALKLFTYKYTNHVHAYFRTTS